MKMRGGLVLVLGLFSVLFSLSFVSAIDYQFCSSCGLSNCPSSFPVSVTCGGLSYICNSCTASPCTLKGCHCPTFNDCSCAYTTCIGQTCSDGCGGSCAGIKCCSSPEICDNKDNDCDGVVDNGGVCYCSNKFKVNPTPTNKAGILAYCASIGSEWKFANLSNNNLLNSAVDFMQNTGKIGIIVGNNPVEVFSTSKKCISETSWPEPAKLLYLTLSSSPVPCFEDFPDSLSLIGLCMNTSASGISCTNIVFPVCGNGKNETGESCDDGNFNNGDGCSSSCSIESGWNCLINSSLGTNCTVSCSNLCPTNNSLELVCLGNNVAHRICKDSSTGCLNWTVPVLNKTCSASQTCLNGACSDVPYTAPESCFSYNTAGTCAAYNKTVAKKDVDNYLFSSFGLSSMPVGGFCGTNNIVKTVALFNGICNYTAVNCSCGWNSTCGKSFDLKRTCTDSTKNAGGNCDISIDVQNTCGSPGGKITQKITAIWKVTSGDLNYKPEKGVCESKNFEYPCPSTQKLPFFGFWNFVISLSLIAVIYAFLNKK